MAYFVHNFYIKCFVIYIGITVSTSITLGSLVETCTNHALITERTTQLNGYSNEHEVMLSSPSTANLPL